MKENKKTLQEKFLDGEKLNLIDNLRINLLQRLSECDGMCGFNSACEYCEIYKSIVNIKSKTKNYKTN